MIDYGKILNKTVTDMPPSGIRRFFELASTMENTISLGVGEPDFITPWEIRDAAIKAIQAGHTQYTSNAGLPALRQEICGYLRSRFNLDYSWQDEVIVTIGASEAIDLALRTVVSLGDEVLVPSPSYVSYCPNVSLVGGVPVSLDLKSRNEFKIMPEDIEKAITSRTKAIILPYPNNPTGAVMTEEELKNLVPVIEKNNLIVISDEIYAELSYGEKHFSFGAIEGMKERTVTISGFSKAFAMTGWRIGYIAAPKEIIKEVYKIHQYTVMCAATFSQYAALEALKSGKADGYLSVENMRQSYDKRRRYLLAEFNGMGLDCFEAKGAFYLFPSVQKLGMTGTEFAEKLLFSKKVAVVPGEAFGESGKYFVRCCYAASLKDLKTAAAKIREFIEER